MPQANYSLGVVQLAQEATAGTAVAATEIWRGKVAYPSDDRNRVISEEEIGLLVPAERSYDTKYGATIALPDTEATYEQLPHILEAGVQTVTPTGAGPYVYSYTFPTDTTFNTIATYTLRCGNAIATADFRVVPYCFVSEFELSGKSGEAWMINANWMGQQLTSGTPTAALSLLAVRPLIFANSLLYVDDSGGTIGSTQLSGVLRAFSIHCNTGVKMVEPGDNSLYYTDHWYDRSSLDFSLTLALENDNDLVAAERTRYDSDAVGLFRINVPGPGGRDFTLDFAGKYDKVNPYEKLDDGSTGVKFDGHVVYSETDSLFVQWDVTNNRADLTS